MLLLSLALSASANPSTGDCADYSGQAYGLCNAYCEAMDCDEDPNANAQACDAVANNFFAATGEEPPCEITEYEVRFVYSGDDSVAVSLDGAPYAFENGEQWWSYANERVETLETGDHTFGIYTWDVGRVAVGVVYQLYVDGVLVQSSDDLGGKITGANPGAGWDLASYDDSTWSTPSLCTYHPWNSSNLGVLQGTEWVWTDSCSYYSSANSQTWTRVNFTLP
ncbi:MAG: hypothetical protein EP330_19965 [Deltaproteobacteria bacterium]|nr:MAG: hypothetical protein EP330_19965 [Deltaproteobacteria bacterium]